MSAIGSASLSSSERQAEDASQNSFKEETAAPGPEASFQLWYSLGAFDAF